MFNMLSMLSYFFFVVCLFTVVVFKISRSTLPQTNSLLPSLSVLVFIVLALTLLDELYNQSSLEVSKQLLSEVTGYTTTPYTEAHLLFPFAYVFILITTTSLLVTLSYSVRNSAIFLLFIVLISAASSLLFAVNSLTLFFVCYELFLLPSFILLFSYAKTRRASEAAFLMFF